jgi:hypothetical protein
MAGGGPPLQEQNLNCDDTQAALIRGIELGYRPMDIAHNWLQDLQVFSDLNTLNKGELFIRNIKQREMQLAMIPHSSESPLDLETLNYEQRQIHDLIISHYKSSLALQSSGQHSTQNLLNPLFAIVSGTAGSGKSYTISAITSSMKGLCDIGQPLPIVVTAFTGVAAFNVRGITLHSLLQLGLGEADEPLSPRAALNLQLKLKFVHYIIIDEMSMISASILARIDHRLREAFPDNQRCPFGGTSIILMGDFAQIPPVGGVPMYYSPSINSKLLNIEGFNLYRLFKKSHRLKQVCIPISLLISGLG